MPREEEARQLAGSAIEEPMDSEYIVSKVRIIGIEQRPQTERAAVRVAGGEIHQESKAGISPGELRLQQRRPQDDFPHELGLGPGSLEGDHRASSFVTRSGRPTKRRNADPITNSRSLMVPSIGFRGARYVRVMTLLCKNLRATRFSWRVSSAARGRSAGSRGGHLSDCDRSPLPPDRAIPGSLDPSPRSSESAIPLAWEGGPAASTWADPCVMVAHAGSQYHYRYTNTTAYRRQEGNLSTPLGRLRAVIREALDAGESQNALAKRLRVAQPTISGWLTEDALDPRASVLERVVRTLGVNGHWLLTGQGDQRVLSGGGDVVFAAGVQAGLSQAEEAIRRLRTISADAAAAASSLEALAMADQAAAGAHRPRRGAGRSAHKPRAAG